MFFAVGNFTVDAVSSFSVQELFRDVAIAVPIGVLQVLLELFLLVLRTLRLLLLELFQSLKDSGR